MTAGLWCRCKHFLWVGDDRPADEDMPVRCHECHPGQPCPACGHPGADQLLDFYETGKPPTYGKPAPVEP